MRQRGYAYPFRVGDIRQGYKENGGAFRSASALPHLCRRRVQGALAFAADRLQRQRGAHFRRINRAGYHRIAEGGSGAADAVYAALGWNAPIG